MRLPDTDDDSSKWKTFDLFWGLHSQQPDFQAEDGIRDVERSRGLGDVYKRQLSALTLPHPLVRVLVTEQLYRAMSMINGHPYHRE